MYDTPFWREEGLNGQALTDLPVARFVVDNSPPDGSIGILLTFLGTVQALDDPAPRRVRRRPRPALRGESGPAHGLLEKDWTHEPWIDGCVSARPPGVLTRYTDAASTPVGRVHWAGTETAAVNEGYLDGAVSAGERAAEEVGAAL